MENTTATSPPPPTTSNHDNNAKISANSTKTREEGELSASENDEFAGSQFPDTTTLPGAPSNKDAYIIGKSNLTRNSTYSGAPSRTSLQSNNRKGTEKNRVPFVISFSDDDSASDSEEHMKENTIESDDMARVVTEKRKFSISTGNTNPQMVQKATKIPKKLSVSRTFLSSMNRVNGTSSKDNNGNTFHIKKSNAPNNNKTGPNVHINSNKLQDLRQLIAIRENELKKASSSLKNSGPNVKLKSTGIRSRDSTEIVEPKEPEKKRLKVNEPPTDTVMAVDQQDRPVIESTLVADVSAPESDVIKGRHEGGYSDKETGRSSAIQQTKKMSKHKMPATNPPSGTGLIRKSRRHDMITNMVESSAPLVAKSSPRKQARLNNPTFWNPYGPTSMSETADMDLKSLLEVEEQQDKELDEAQEHRRKCEIEERNALKEYRKAQRALAEANAKCSYLYHKREVFSANLRSHVMEDSTMFWSNMSPHQHTGPKLVSESCGEPDTSSSKEEEEKTNDASSSLHENNDNNNNNDNTLAEDEETSAFELKGGDSSLDEGTWTKNENSVSVDPTEDSLLLEATLRSQLFERLKNRGSKKMESGQSIEPPCVEREDGEIMEASETFHESLNEPTLKSAFCHVKFIKPVDETKVVEEPRQTDCVSNLLKLDILVTEIGSYSNKLPIDPSWPLCMFELRGKCNNDECPWQHLKDDYSSNDGAVLKSGNGCVPLAPPTYLVCLDSLKADSHPYKYLLTQTVEQRWQKYFSASLVVSSSVLADDEPYLHGPETRIEVNGGWNRQSSYFHGQNVKEGLLPDQHMDDTHQPLELALVKLTREVNKHKGRREALIVLARALEEHPTSVLVWIVYLHIYYSNQKSVGKDDLFHYAIEHNDSSYELWLMYINSRDKLDDRLLGYTTAMSALCRHASDSDNSECILDLFLQLLNCLVSSGEVNKAIRKVYHQLIPPSTKKSHDEPDILTYLTTSDKCVLWVCSIYLVMYKKLPDTIVQQLECPKQLPPSIQWHPVHLAPEEKQKAVTLMELACESLKEVFALNHIKCTAVLEGLDSSKILLKKYLQLYPWSLELVLLCIRMNEFESAYEEALRNWGAGGGPGVECIWNQYAEYALGNGKVEFAKEVMERWNNSRKKDDDTVFGLVNLSLHKQLQNQHTEARIAIEQALEVATSFEDYTHCAKEHALFFLKTEDSFLKRLKQYVSDSRAVRRPCAPLSRSFIQTIKNPKIEKLVNSLLTPISSDFSLMNSLLESCFGPSLVPEKQQADFAEGLMEMRPGNYELALSLCKIQLAGNSSSKCFWAGSMLINCLFQAVPVAPESVWVEAATVLGKMLEFRSVLESFHKRALSVYPCSLRLWKLYLGLYARGEEEGNLVIQMAREKGLNI